MPREWAHEAKSAVALRWCSSVLRPAVPRRRKPGLVSPPVRCLSSPTEPMRSCRRRLHSSSAPSPSEVDALPLDRLGRPRREDEILAPFVTCGGVPCSRC
eukprot:1300344-Pyramimonas_sp.AAC.1